MNIPKNYPELEIQISRQLQYTVIGGKFKFQAQDSFFGIFFLRFGDLKNTLHFLKKHHLYAKSSRASRQRKDSPFGKSA